MRCRVLSSARSQPSNPTGFLRKTTLRPPVHRRAIPTSDAMVGRDGAAQSAESDSLAPVFAVRQRILPSIGPPGPEHATFAVFGFGLPGRDGAATEGGVI